MLMDVKTMSATASGLTLEPAAKLMNAGTHTPSTAMTEPMNMWMIMESAATSRANREDVLGHGAGKHDVGDPGVLPVAPPTEPTAMAAVRNMRDLMSTAFQLAGVRTSPMMGMARDADGKRHPADVIARDGEPQRDGDDKPHDGADLLNGELAERGLLATICSRS